jgi:hypothetical protein
MNVMNAPLDPADYFVVVKNRARLPKPWRWEIHRAGRQSPVAQSQVFFDLRGTAIVDGRAALNLLLKKVAV